MKKRNLTRKGFAARINFLGMFLLMMTIALVSEAFTGFSGATMCGASLAMAGISGTRERAIFDGVRKKFPNFTPSPGYLRIEQALANGKTNYLFDIKQNGAEVSTETKLDRNDVFVVHSLAIFLSAQNSTTIGKEPLQTYPNKVAFGSTTGFNYKDLECVYNGYLSLKIGQKINIERMPLIHFRKIPTTQEIAAITYGASVTQSGSQKIDYSQFDLQNVAYPLESLMFLHGTMDAKFEIAIPQWVGAQIANTAANVSNKLVLFPIGLLVKGAAQNNK